MLKQDFIITVGLLQNGSLRQANLKILFERAKDYEKTSFKGLFNFIRFIEKLKKGNSDLSQAKIIGENEDVVRIMSIHKSKGLEFPIVFLCNSNKGMNKKDWQGEVVLHKDLGFGLQYIDTVRKIEYPTCSKIAMKVKLEQEAISEEMRILYVALTRAREKLIITGVRKNEEKELEAKRFNLKNYFNGNKISPILIKNKTSYLDWIEYVILNYELQGKKYEYLDFSVINSNEILEEKEETEKREIDFSKYNDFKKLEEKLNWKYRDEFLTELPIKTTVSALKKLENENVDFFDLTNSDISLKEIVPEFLKDDKITASRIGTITHLVLQKIDFNNIKTENDVREFLQKLVSKNFIKQDESEKISTKEIFDFINSDFALNIKKAKNVYKEKSFCLEVEASRIFKNEDLAGNLLVQGIIDLYYEKENGNLVLVDYKTDFVKKDKNELIEKYKIQLELYKEALEKGTNKSVEEVYIYSLYLNKAIKLF